MEESVQFDASAVLPPGKEPSARIGCGAGWDHGLGCAPNDPGSFPVRGKEGTSLYAIASRPALTSI